MTGDNRENMNTILVTGTNRGLGLEFVKQFLDDGWQVLACCRKPEVATDLLQVLTDHPDQLSLFPLDVSDLAAIQTLAAQLEGQSIDLLLNNAGIYGSNRHNFSNVDYTSWQQVFMVNAMAPMRMAESFVEHVAKSQKKKMVFMSSKMGSQGDNSSGGSYLYRSSKSALNAVVKSLSHDLVSRGISTLALHPGWVHTDMGGPHALIDVEESVQGLRRAIQGLSVGTTGRFIDYAGNEIPW